MITSGEDLRTAIRELAEHEPDPARITHKLLNSITPSEAHVIVTVTLHDYVRRTVTHPSAQLSQDMHESSLRTYSTQSGQRTVSGRIAAARDWIDSELIKSICVNPGTRDWLHLGDCTRENCLAAAASRHRKAAETTAEATRFELIAEALEEHDARTVRDLPRDVLRVVLAR